MEQNGAKMDEKGHQNRPGQPRTTQDSPQPQMEQNGTKNGPKRAPEQPETAQGHPRHATTPLDSRGQSSAPAQAGRTKDTARDSPGGRQNSLGQPRPTQDGTQQPQDNTRDRASRFYVFTGFGVFLVSFSGPFWCRFSDPKWHPKGLKKRTKFSTPKWTQNGSPDGSKMDPGRH